MTIDQHPRLHRRVASSILVVVLVYVALLCVGLPQRATEKIVSHLGDHDAASAHQTNDFTAADVQVHHPPATSPPYWMIAPFALLLVSIAVLPLLPATANWWESNLHRFGVALGLSMLVLGYYAFVHYGAIEAHWPTHRVIEPNEGLLQFQFVSAVVANAILQEYIPFIVLLFSLYTISGGIRITGDLRATPLTNTAFLAIGTLLASFIGTTGAGMLLIRPLLETNRERQHVAHTVVIFIFTVCNCGGCLLPLGDPPLFLGYLQGVPFLWTFTLWREWLFVNGVLLVIYYTLDSLWYYRRESLADVARDIERRHRLRIVGWKLNMPLLIGIVLAVAFLDPTKSIPGTPWHAWLYLREVVQLGFVALSLQFGSRQARESNEFNYHAIVEVAAIFTGIFITMQPALQILKERGPELGIQTPVQFFWATGILSSILDNAPTYLELIPEPHDR